MSSQPPLDPESEVHKLGYANLSSPKGLAAGWNKELPYSVNKLKYTLGGLIIVSSWMIGGFVCFQVMQQIFPTLMPFQLKQIGASNESMGVLTGSLPALLIFLLVPVISFTSDRFRSSWGRRRPFILVTAPFLVIFLISLAYVRDIFTYMGHHQATLAHYHISVLTGTTIVIGILITLFQFFDDFVNSVGWYLIADVIPVEVMGRFNAFMSLFTIGGLFVWNTYIFPLTDANRHKFGPDGNPLKYYLDEGNAKWCYWGMALLYLFGYGMMCLMVREGEYPPIDPNEKRASRFHQARIFLRESFTHPLFISMFLFDTLWAVTNACSTWTRFFGPETLGLSGDQIGTILGYGGIVAAICILPLGLLIDWLTPLRTLIVATILLIPGAFITYFIHGYHSYLILILITAPIGALWDATQTPMKIQMLPKAKYGQFSSANAMVRSLARVVLPIIGARYMDRVNNNYRMIYVWQGSWMIVALGMLLFVYYQYRKNGGPNKYVAPVPVSEGDHASAWAKVAGWFLLLASGCAWGLIYSNYPRLVWIKYLGMGLALAAAMFSFGRLRAPALVCSWIFVVLAGGAGLFALKGGFAALIINGGGAAMCAMFGIFGLAGFEEEPGETSPGAPAPEDEGTKQLVEHLELFARGRITIMVIDAHVHFDGIALGPKMLEDQKNTGVDQFNILVIGRDNVAHGGFKQAEAVWFKLNYPKKVFAFGGLDFSGMFDHGRSQPDVPFVDQLEAMRAAGFDGLKLLSGKPDRRKWIGQPLDGPTYTPMLKWLEETRFPIIWHVGDPPEFWDENAVPLWAKKNRWWYDNTHPPKKQIDREIANVQDRHPRLNLIHPHFFFMSDDLKAAAALLDRHPNIQFDLTPGVEMNHNFSKDPEGTHRFFVKYADRIIYGTDIGMMNHGTGPKRGWMIRHFLETDDVFEVPDDPAMTPDDRPPLRGIKLPADVLEKIYVTNFQRVLGAKMPLPLNPAGVKKMMNQLIESGAKRGERYEAAEVVLSQI